MSKSIRPNIDILNLNITKRDIDIKYILNQKDKIINEINEKLIKQEKEIKEIKENNINEIINKKIKEIENKLIDLLIF